MGIPKFYGFLRDNYSNVLRRNVPRFVSSFSLDMNGIIHNRAQFVYAYGEYADPIRRKFVEQADPKMLEAEFHNAISVKLQEILVQVQPTETFAMAIDGVAPQAKISQQRQRRFKNTLTQEGKVVFDSNCISPGTDFMIRLDNFLQRWIVAYQATLPPKVIYSSHMVPNEGEHKILDLMRSGEISGEGAHVLYGMDADLIMLSMLAPLNNISLMREDIRDVIDIDAFKQVIQAELRTETAIHDYVVMMFMIGNDFLPHSPALEDMDLSIRTMIDVYKKTGRSITRDDDIEWEGLSSFLTALASYEPKLLEHEATRDVKYPSRMLAAASTRTEKIEEGTKMLIGKKITFSTVLDYNVFRGAWYQNELLPKDLTVFRKVLPGYNFGITTEKVVNMCREYLIGMAWVYNYYIKGTEAINSDYVFRYHHTPLLSDVAAVLSQIKTVEGYLAHDGQVVLNPIHQLLAVLPLKSKDLLPNEVKHLMSKDSPISDMYPANAVVEMDGKNNEWQGIVLIPFIDPERIIMAVNTTTVFSVERASLYAQANNIILQKEKEMIALDIQKREFRQYIEKQKHAGRGRGRSGGYQSREGYQGRGRGKYQKPERTLEVPEKPKSPRRNISFNPNAPAWQPTPKVQGPKIQESAISTGLPPISKGLPPIAGLPPLKAPVVPQSTRENKSGWKGKTIL